MQLFEILVVTAKELWLASVPLVLLMLLSRPYVFWISVTISVVAALVLGAFPSLAYPKGQTQAAFAVLLWAVAMLVFCVGVVLVRGLVWAIRSPDRFPTPPTDDGSA